MAARALHGGMLLKVSPRVFGTPERDVVRKGESACSRSYFAVATLGPSIRFLVSHGGACRGAVE